MQDRRSVHLGALAMPPRSSPSWKSSALRAALDRPRCRTCGLLMRLSRMAPVMLARPLKIERSYECDCGATLRVEEAAE